MSLNIHKISINIHKQSWISWEISMNLHESQHFQLGPGCLWELHWLHSSAAPPLRGSAKPWCRGPSPRRSRRWGRAAGRGPWRCRLLGSRAPGWLMLLGETNQQPINWGWIIIGDDNHRGWSYIKDNYSYLGTQEVNIFWPYGRSCETSKKNIQSPAKPETSKKNGRNPKSSICLILFPGPSCRPHWHWAQWEIKDIRGKGKRNHDINPRSMCTQSRWRTYYDDNCQKSGMKIWDYIARPILFMCCFHILRAMGCFFWLGVKEAR